MDSETKDIFFSDPTDYYYRYRISSIMEAKDNYNAIIKVVIDNKTAIFSNIGADAINKFFRKIYTLRSNFNMYSNMLIKQNGINSNDKYSRSIENLMLVLNETILFFEDKIILNKDIKLKRKFKYKNRSVSLRTIISDLKNIPYLLNADEPVNVVIDKYQFLIVLFTAIFIGVGLLFLLALFLNPVLDYANSIYSRLFNIDFDYLSVLSAVFIILLPTAFFFKIILSKGYRMAKVKSEVYGRNKSIVYKPFKTNRKAFKYGIAAVKYLLGFFHSGE